jgi:hypothetical protein
MGGALSSGNKAVITESDVSKTVVKSFLDMVTESSTTITINQNLSITNNECGAQRLAYCTSDGYNEQICSEWNCNIHDVMMVGTFSFTSESELSNSLSSMSSTALAEKIQTNLKQDNNALVTIDNTTTESISSLSKSITSVDAKSLVDDLVDMNANQSTVIDGGDISGISMYLVSDVVTKHFATATGYQATTSSIAKDVSASLEQSNGSNLSILWWILIVLGVLALGVFIWKVAT